MNDRVPDNASQIGRLDDICDRFEAAWKDFVSGEGERPQIEAYLVDTSAADQSNLLEGLLPIELDYRVKLGEEPTPDEYGHRFSQHVGLVKEIVLGCQSSNTPVVLVSTKVCSGTPVDGQNECPESDAQPSVELPAEIANYSLVTSDPLGAGAQGAVYHYRHKYLDRDVAIKLPRGAYGSTEYAQMVLQEACRATELDHPNFVKVYDAGPLPDGRIFIAMEKVAGRQANDALQAKPPHEVAAIIQKTAQAIDAAHQHGILHRDIKPGNILIHESGNPKLVDFGLAQRIPDASHTVEYSYGRAGTAGFMAPEVVQGLPYSRGADIYSLGATLYYLLTRGRTPVAIEKHWNLNRRLRDWEKYAERIASTDPELPRIFNRSIPKPLQDVCLKAIERDPSARYSTAAEFADDLGRFLTGRPVHANPSVYKTKLESKVSETIGTIERWEQEGIVSGREVDLLISPLRQMVDAEERRASIPEWVRLRGWEVFLFVGALLLLTGPLTLIYFWEIWRRFPGQAFGRDIFTVLCSLFALANGVWFWRKAQERKALPFLITFVLLLVPAIYTLYQPSWNRHEVAAAPSTTNARVKPDRAPLDVEQGKPELEVPSSSPVSPSGETTGYGPSAAPNHLFSQAEKGDPQPGSLVPDRQDHVPASERVPEPTPSESLQVARTDNLEFRGWVKTVFRSDGRSMPASTLDTLMLLSVSTACVAGFVALYLTRAAVFVWIDSFLIVFASFLSYLWLFDWRAYELQERALFFFPVGLILMGLGLLFELRPWLSLRQKTSWSRGLYVVGFLVISLAWLFYASTGRPAHYIINWTHAEDKVLLSFFIGGILALLIAVLADVLDTPTLRHLTLGPFLVGGALSLFPVNILIGTHLAEKPLQWELALLINCIWLIHLAVARQRKNLLYQGAVYLLIAIFQITHTHFPNRWYWPLALTAIGLVIMIAACIRSTADESLFRGVHSRAFEGFRKNARPRDVVFLAIWAAMTLTLLASHTPCAADARETIEQPKPTDPDLETVSINGFPQRLNGSNGPAHSEPVLADQGSSTPESADPRQMEQRKEKELVALMGDLARNCVILGHLQKAMGEAEEATGSFQKAIEVYEVLVEQHPEVPEYREQLARAYAFGIFKETTGKAEETAASYHKAIEIFELLIHEHLRLPEYRSGLTLAYLWLGNLGKTTGEAAAAAESYQNVIEIYQRLVDEHPEVPEYRNDLAAAYNNLGDVKLTTGKPKKAAGAYQKAIEIFEPLVEEYPQVPEYRNGLAAAYNNRAAAYNDLGDVEHTMAKAEKVAVLCGKAIRFYQELWKQDPQIREYANSLVFAHLRRAAVLTELGRYEQALADWNSAIELDLDIGLPRDALRLMRAHTRAMANQHGRAAADADELAIQTDASTWVLWGCACVFSLSSKAAAEDKNFAEAERKKLAETYAARAVELLTQACAKDYFNRTDVVEHMKKDPDLDLLRQRKDFQNLVRDLDAATKDEDN